MAEPAAVDAKTPPDVLQGALSRVRRRELASRILEIASLDLLVALSAYAGYLVVERLFGLPERGLLALAVALGGAVLATAIRAALTLRLSYFGAAVLADERLRVKERVSSAVYVERCADLHAAPGLRDLVKKDGERALQGVDIARHFPIRVPRMARWTLAPAALAVVFAFLPALDLLGLRESRQVDAAMRREVEKKRDELAKAIEDLRKEAEKPPDPDLQKILDALEKRLKEESEAATKAAEPPSAGEEAKKDALMEFARLEDLLKKELEAAKFDDLKAFLDRFPPGSLSKSPLTGALREAMKSGNLSKALSELGKLKDQLSALGEKEKAGQLSPEDLEKMKKLAEELSRLAKDSTMLSKLSSSFAGASGSLSAGDLSKAIENLESLLDDMESLADLLKDLQFLEGALELAQLSMDELSKLHKCPNCGRLSQEPGGT